MKKIRQYFIDGVETSEDNWMKELHNEESLATLELKQECIDVERLLCKIKELEEENRRLRNKPNNDHWWGGQPYISTSEPSILRSERTSDDNPYKVTF